LVPSSAVSVTSPAVTIASSSPPPPVLSFLLFSWRLPLLVWYPCLWNCVSCPALPEAHDVQPDSSHSAASTRLLFLPTPSPASTDTAVCVSCLCTSVSSSSDLNLPVLPRSHSPLPSIPEAASSMLPVIPFPMNSPSHYLYWLFCHHYIQSGHATPLQLLCFSQLDASLRAQLALDSTTLTVSPYAEFDDLLYRRVSSRQLLQTLLL